MNNSSLSSSAYRSEIDGLRAIAVLSVVIFHAFPSWLRGGFIGVDIFFVISGFLISTNILADLESNRFSFVDFFGRRIRRLFPALIIVIACSLVFGWAVLFADEYAQLGKHTASAVAFVLNFILVSEVGYFASSAETKPMLHLWSLAVEEQFYLIWPFILVFVWRRHSHLLLIIACCALVSFAVNLLLVEVNTAKAFFYPFGRFWEFISGCMLACLMRYKPKPFEFSRSLSDKLSSVGLALLCMSLFLINENSPFPSYVGVLPVLGTVFILAAGPLGLLSRYLLANPIVKWCGLISYPLYLWHWPLLSYAQILNAGELPDRHYRIGLVLTAFVLSWITHIFVETPLRFGRCKSLKTCFLLVVLGSLGILGLKISQDGLPQRAWLTTSEVNERSFKSSFENLNGGICLDLQEAIDDPWCSYTRMRPKTVLLGDSHAPPLYIGMKDLYEDLDRGVAIFGGGNGCPPLYGVVSKASRSAASWGCMTHISAALKVIIKSDTIEDVFLVGRGPLYTTANGFGGIGEDAFGDWILHLNGEAAYSRPNATVYRIGLQQTVKLLTDAGKRVVYVFDVPELGFIVSECFDYRPLSLKNPRVSCTVSKEAYDSRNAAFKLLVREVLSEFPSVKTIDLSTALCGEEVCIGAVGDRSLYLDDDHLSDFGARFTVNKLARKFRELYQP